MIETRPPRALGMALSLILLLISLVGVADGLLRLAEAGISPQLVLWLGMVLVGLPLGLWAAYRSYNLLTASYQLDRERFLLRWGAYEEQAPLSQVVAVEQLPRASERPPWLMRMLLPLASPRRIGAETWFATDDSRLIRLDLGERTLVISPENPQAFEQAFIAATRQGSLTSVERRSRHPDLLPARLWSDPLARGLLLAGLLQPLLFLALLALLAARLPETIPFGFQPQGIPGPSTPTGRLLLLPLTGVVIWLVDLLAGAWFYRRSNWRTMSYWVWGAGALVGGGLFAGGLLMVGLLP